MRVYCPHPSELTPLRSRSLIGPKLAGPSQQRPATAGPAIVDGSVSDLALRLKREAQIIAQLEHPGIVPVHDVGVFPVDRVYCAMKLVRGAELDVWLERDPPRPTALRLFQKICEAVAFAHATGVIHRDLKHPTSWWASSATPW